MINIRNNVFETNSSSVHTISILGDSICDIKPLRGVLKIHLRYYGRENDIILSTPQEKLEYLMTSAIQKYHGDEYDIYGDSLKSLKTFLKKLSDDYNNEYERCKELPYYYWLSPISHMIYILHTKIKSDFKIKFVADDDFGIDHQSCYDILDSKIDLESMIFNPVIQFKLSCD